jgi:hypothetical protein
MDDINTLRLVKMKTFLMFPKEEVRPVYEEVYITHGQCRTLLTTAITFKSLIEDKA